MPSWSNRGCLLSYVILIVIFILGGLATAELFRTAWQRGKVSEANFDKIELGMAEQDVEAILGIPVPRVYDYQTIVPVWDLKSWSGWHNLIVIGLDKDWRVVEKDFHCSRDMFSVYRDEHGRIWSYSRSTQESVEVRPNP